MRNVVKNIYLLLIDNAIVLHAALQLSIAITLRDARLITIAPTFIGATIRRALITIYTKQVQVAADSTQRIQTIVRMRAKCADVMV